MKIKLAQDKKAPKPIEIYNARQDAMMQGLAHSKDKDEKKFRLR